MFPVLPQGQLPHDGNILIHTLRLPFFLALSGATGLYFGLPGSVLHLPPLALLFPFCLYIISSLSPSDAHAFIHGWLAGFLGNCAGLYWLVFPMHDVAGLPFFLALPCVMLLFAYFACYSGLTVVGMRRLRRLFSSQKSPEKAKALRLLLPPLLGGIAYAGFEVICGTLFTGFPWLSLSTSFAFLPVWVQAASLIGGYGLSAFLAVSACLAASALLAIPEKCALVPAACAGILLFFLPAYGMVRLDAQKPNPTSSSFALIMVQGNIDQSQKWEPVFQKTTVERYMVLSKRALQNARSAASPRLALLLWPETAMPFYFPQHGEYAETLRRFTSDNKISLAFGSLGMEYEKETTAAASYRLYNRLYLLSPSGQPTGFYDKRHLVPFGEYLPFAANISFLRNLLQGMDFSPGVVTEPLRLTVPGSAGQASSPSVSASLGVLICYEAIFPALAQERTTHGAEVLVNISNDGWFRQSSAPWQHLSHAVMRAVEQGRPLLRATNTGISAVIDATGTITARITDLFTENTLTATVHPATGKTFFHRIFPVPEILLTVLAIFSLFGYKLRRTHQTQEFPCINSLNLNQP